jgi:hypothetical protein
MAAVRMMNEIGVAVDLSHSGYLTTSEGIVASSKPVLISHSGCAAVYPHPRSELVIQPQVSAKAPIKKQTIELKCEIVEGDFRVENIIGPVSPPTMARRRTVKVGSALGSVRR